MNIFKRISQKVILEDDKSYWDKKATVLEWQKQTGKKLSSNSTNQDIYDAAVKDGYNVSWEDLADGFPDYFIELSGKDVWFAISAGILTAFTARYIDSIGSELGEKKDKDKKIKSKSLERILSEKKDKHYDTNNPFDLRRGTNHRKMGHDVFSFFLKNIPGDYVMKDKSGVARKVAEIVGGSTENKFSMSDIINATYGTGTNNFFKGIWDKMQHTIFHLAKDLVTPNGIPIPFTALLNKFSEANNVSGYKVENRILDNVQNEFVTMRASDFTSIGAINLLHGGYYQLRKSEWEKFDKDTIKANKAQLKVLSYCSCVITQMFFYLFKTSDLHSLKDRETNKNNGGTLNWAMLTLIIKNVAQVFYYQSKTNNLLLEEQQQLIDVLLKEQETHE